MKTIITIGTGYSGSSAIYDFLKKTNKFTDPFPDKEFSLSYDPGGLLDLEEKILKAKSINQVNFTISQFVWVKTSGFRDLLRVLNFGRPYLGTIDENFG